MRLTLALFSCDEFKSFAVHRPWSQHPKLSNTKKSLEALMDGDDIPYSSIHRFIYHLEYCTFKSRESKTGTVEVKILLLSIQYT
jgi:hypothetical protein